MIMFTFTITSREQFERALRDERFERALKDQARRAPANEHDEPPTTLPTGAPRRSNRETSAARESLASAAKQLGINATDLETHAATVADRPRPRVRREGR